MPEWCISPRLFVIPPLPAVKSVRNPWQVKRILKLRKLDSQFQTLNDISNLPKATAFCWQFYTPLAIISVSFILLRFGDKRSESYMNEKAEERREFLEQKSVVVERQSGAVPALYSTQNRCVQLRLEGRGGMWPGLFMKERVRDSLTLVKYYDYFNLTVKWKLIVIFD